MDNAKSAQCQRGWAKQKMIKQTQMKSGPPGAVGQRWAVILAGGEVGLVFGVRRFWEKPSRAVANDLMCRGCFWNSFIMVGRVASFMSLAARAVPNLVQSCQNIAPVFFTRDEEASVHDLYRTIPSSSFSTDALSAHPGNLAVSCNRTLEWTDVGDVDRALSLVRCEVPQMEGSDEQETVRVATAAG